MGAELQCQCEWNGRTSSGKALLETDHLLFRGEFRLKLPFTGLSSVRADQGRLHLDSTQGKVIFELGAAAAKWVQKILHPPSRASKLGIKPGTAITIIGLEDEVFEREVAEIGGEIVVGKSAAPDVIFFAAEHPDDLKSLRALRRSMKPAGAIWVVYPKGIRTITEADVLAGGRGAGLVDVKVVGFSKRETALKFVVPLKERG